MLVYVIYKDINLTNNDNKKLLVGPYYSMGSNSMDNISLILRS